MLHDEFISRLVHEACMKGESDRLTNERGRTRQPDNMIILNNIYRDMLVAQVGLQGEFLSDWHLS